MRDEYMNEFIFFLETKMERQLKKIDKEKDIKKKKVLVHEYVCTSAARDYAILDRNITLDSDTE